MEELTVVYHEVLKLFPWRNVFLGVFFLVLGQVLFKSVASINHLLSSDKKETKEKTSFKKLFKYFYYVALFIIFLKILRVDMKVVLGATGLLTIAIGFAARVPISNLISGLFLVFERPFVVGDIIEINEYRGEVVSLNLLSLTLRTLDNLMVRIPNELVISCAVSNRSYFPIRRLDLRYILSNRESLTRLQQVFMGVAERNELALDEPTPYFFVEEFRETSIVVMFRVWTSIDEYMEFQSEFPKEIHRAIKQSGFDPIMTITEFQNKEITMSSN